LRSPPRKKVDETPNLQSIEELVLRRIEKAKQINFGEPKVTTTRASESPLLKDILTCEFFKKFVTPTINTYIGMSDPMQHL